MTTNQITSECRHGKNSDRLLKRRIKLDREEFEKIIGQHTVFLESVFIGTCEAGGEDVTETADIYCIRNGEQGDTSMASIRYFVYFERNWSVYSTRNILKVGRIIRAFRKNLKAEREAFVPSL